jgi:hypothetical protein
MPDIETRLQRIKEGTAIDYWGYNLEDITQDLANLIELKWMLYPEEIKVEGNQIKCIVLDSNNVWIKITLEVA